MEARILATTTLISPFGDKPADCPVRGRALHQEMAANLAQIKATITPDASTTPERLLLTDDFWCSVPLLRDFLKQARAEGKPCILAIEEGLLTDFSAHLQVLGQAQPGDKACKLYPLAWIPEGVALEMDDPTTCEGLTPVIVDLKTHPLEMPVHKVFTPEEKIIVPLTARACVRISHWMHVLRANQLGQIVWGATLFMEPWRLAWAATRAMSFNKWSVMQRLVIKGKNCDIHPSAVVEASTLGDNVTIGANAVVRYSHLSDGARVSDQCNVLSSVLGPGASVARMGMLQSCVLFEGANSGHYGLQLCLVGRETFVGGEVLLGDFKPEGEIKVMHNGALQSTGTNLLGCAVGHDCRLMMRATFYAGREIPNGVTVIGPSRDVVASIPADLPTDELLTTQDGSLISYKEWRASIKRSKGEL